MDAVYVLGGAQTDFERNWKKEGKGMIALLREVISDGLAQVSLSFDNVKLLNKDNRIACFIGNFLAEKFVNQSHLGAFLTEVSDAFYGVPAMRCEAACASSSAAIDAARCSIRAGECDVAIVVGCELMKTVDSNTCGDFLGLAAYCEKEASGIVLPFPKLFGRLADETLNKYPDLDEKRYMDALARISVKNYANAKRNPLAQTRKWFMSFEQASTRGTPTNPLTGGRLAVSDCSQVTDGACLLVLCSEAFMRERGIRGKPELVGYGHRNAPLLFSKKMDESRSSDYLLPWTRQTVLDAYRRSALSVDDMDVFETHDCFTSSEYAAISAFGLTKPGEEYQAVESGLIAFDGAKPINPSGGLIGCGHPVGASGARMMLDLYKQLTGTAGAYQVKGARNGMMLNFGGSATTNYAFVLSMRDRAGLEGCPWR